MKKINNRYNNSNKKGEEVEIIFEEEEIEKTRRVKVLKKIILFKRQNRIRAQDLSRHEGGRSVT